MTNLRFIRALTISKLKPSSCVQKQVVVTLNLPWLPVSHFMAWGGETIFYSSQYYNGPFSPLFRTIRWSFRLTNLF